MINIPELFRIWCLAADIPFTHEKSVLSYDDTTLFCPAGMQQFKTRFKDDSYKDQTIANIQPCIRLNDLSLLGDGTHLAYFNMIGLFSFRCMTVYETIDFWLQFLRELGLTNITVTHPSWRKEWKDYYHMRSIAYGEPKEIKVDEDCKWSDGDIGGDCTEFYVNGVEVGNIVNPMGDCIDVGFGLERLDQLVNNTPPKTEIESLKDVVNIIIRSGVKPGNKDREYVLRRLLRRLALLNGDLPHQYFRDEMDRQAKLLEKYDKLKHKNIGKSNEWWFDTHGIDITLL